MKYDGKDSVEISCDEFLEVPFNLFERSVPSRGAFFSIPTNQFDKKSPMQYSMRDFSSVYLTAERFSAGLYQCFPDIFAYVNMMSVKETTRVAGGDNRD